LLQLSTLAGLGEFVSEIAAENVTEKDKDGKHFLHFAMLYTVIAC